MKRLIFTGVLVFLLKFILGVFPYNDTEDIENNDITVTCKGSDKKDKDNDVKTSRNTTSSYKENKR